jgi:hypothetical protein
MSHYPILIIGDDIDVQLEPFFEGGPLEEPEPWHEFFDVEDEFRWHYEEGIFDGPFERREFPEKCGKPNREAFASFDLYMEAVYGPRDEITGRYGDWWNPSGQFDWYEVGGRWSDYLVLKPRDATAAPAEAETADEVLKKDLDVEATFRPGSMPRAILRDGEWIDAAEKDPAEWRAEILALIASLDDETLLTIVDCHA